MPVNLIDLLYGLKTDPAALAGHAFIFIRSSARYHRAVSYRVRSSSFRRTSVGQRTFLSYQITPLSDFKNDMVISHKLLLHRNSDAGVTDARGSYIHGTGAYQVRKISYAHTYTRGRRLFKVLSFVNGPLPTQHVSS